MENTSDVDNNENFDYPITSIGPIVSPALREEGRRERNLMIEREERAQRKPIKRKLLEVLLGIFEQLLIFLLEYFQNFSQYLNPFETKHTEEELAYLAMSLPNTVRTADQILLYYPLISRTQRYKILKMRKDKIAMYERIFKKNK